MGLEGRLGGVIVFRFRARLLPTGKGRGQVESVDLPSFRQPIPKYLYYPIPIFILM